MALEIADPTSISSEGSNPRPSRHIAGAYYRGYGRNAWHSTWVNIYSPNSVSFRFSELRSSAERQRTQGSVQKIEAIPLAPVLQGADLYGIVPINERGAPSYARLRGAIRSGNLWQSLPSRRENWLLTFRVQTWDILFSSFQPGLWRASSVGARFMLNWSQVDTSAERFSEFLKFATWLRRHSRENWEPSFPK